MLRFSVLVSCHHASSKRIVLFKCFIFICFDILVLPIKYTPQCSEAFTQFLVSNDFLLYVVWFVSGSSSPRHPCGCQMHSFYDNCANWSLKYFSRWDLSLTIFMSNSKHFTARSGLAPCSRRDFTTQAADVLNDGGNITGQAAVGRGCHPSWR